jgi:formylglycine-generating enzyme required for sulfatase activity
MELVVIPPGEFDMGSSEEEFQKQSQRFSKFFTDGARRSAGEGPVHKVRITRPFRIGGTEVTVAQFRAFVADTGHKSDAERGGKGGTALVEANKLDLSKFGKGGKGFKGTPTFAGQDHEVHRADFTWEKPGFTATGQHPACNVTPRTPRPSAAG